MSYDGRSPTVVVEYLLLRSEEVATNDADAEPAFVSDCGPLPTDGGGALFEVHEVERYELLLALAEDEMICCCKRPPLDDTGMMSVSKLSVFVLRHIVCKRNTGWHCN